LEYKIIEVEPSIKVKRLTFTEIFERGHLDEDFKLKM
jgi:hypothetical protein